MKRVKLYNLCFLSCAGTSISPKITVGALELAINYNNIKHACELVEGETTIKLLLKLLIIIISISISIIMMMMMIIMIMVIVVLTCS